MEEGGARAGRAELTEEDVRVLKEHLRRQKAVFRLQVGLLDQEHMSVARLRAAARRFQPADLDDLAEERKLNSLCGYPLCGNPPRTQVPNLRVVDAARRRIVDADQARRFCSMDCLHRLELLKVQVPANGPESRIEIPLMDGTSDKEKGADSAAEAPGGGGSAQTVANLVSSAAPVVEREVDRSTAPSESFPAPGSRVSTYAVEGYRSVPEDKAARAALAEKIKAKKQSSAPVNAPSSKDAAPAPDLAAKTAVQIVDQLRELGINEDADFVRAAKEAAGATPMPTRDEPAQAHADDAQSDAGPLTAEPSAEELTDLYEGDSYDKIEELDTAEDQQAGDQDADALDSVPGFGFFDISTLSEDISSFAFTPMMRFTDVLNAWTTPRQANTASSDEPDPITQSRSQVLHSNLSKACGVVVNSLPAGRLYRSACQQTLLEASASFNHSRPVQAFSAKDWQVLSAVMLHALVPTSPGLDNAMLGPLRSFATSPERGKAKLEEAEFDSFASYTRVTLAGRTNAAPPGAPPATLPGSPPESNQ